MEVIVRLRSFVRLILLSKMHDGRRGQALLLEDLAGSKHWENIVDQGFVSARSDSDPCAAICPDLPKVLRLLTEKACPLDPIPERGGTWWLRGA